jgi:hypothetical protein
MRILLYVMLFVSGEWLQTAAQSMELSGSKVTLPEGNVLGVAFHEQTERFFVQQLVLTTGEGGRGVLSSRQLSSWSLKNRSMSAKRMLDPNPRHLDTYPRGRIEVSSKSNKLLLCSAETYMEVLDPDSLNTVGKIAYRNDQYIYDFALDDTRGWVLVLSLRGDDSPRLTSYSLVDGSQQQETVLPPTGERRMMLAIVEKTGQIVVATDQSFHGVDKSDIYICGSDATLACAKAALIDRVSQISLLAEDLLVATNTFADRRKECLISVDVGTHSVSRKGGGVAGHPTDAASFSQQTAAVELRRFSASSVLDSRLHHSYLVHATASNVNPSILRGRHILKKLVGIKLVIYYCIILRKYINSVIVDIGGVI